MSGPRNIPPAASARQQLASDPASSVFVSANAGSGKTYVLVNRVIRLLLDGVPPEKILCVTFTKAAAANMAERVFTRLGHWVTLDDAALDAEIGNAGVPASNSRLRSRARELFASALETPGGLKVQTIHALCTRLLQQFPFEANVPARFSVLDDRDQNEMMERASLQVLLHAAAAPDSAEGRALTTAMTSAADVTFRDVVREASLSRDQFLAWIERAGSTDAAMAQLSATLGVGPGDTRESVELEIIDGPNLPRERWILAADVFETGTTNDIKQGARLREALSYGGTEQIDAYLSVFLTDKQELRKSFATKTIEKNNPGLFNALIREADRIAPLLERRRAVAMRERTQSLLVIASQVAENYRREKNERGLLDYDDLIARTLEMLDRVSSSWVHFKLDRGVDHVLIDEAQDTSPRQWDIITHLISEFTSGEGARDGIKRTIFAVGDEKQSIFSFQGAAPREFDLRRKALQGRFKDAGMKFDPIAFSHSFRSGSAILQSVDHVFREEAIFRSIHAVENGYPIHETLEDAGPSLIDLWELEQPDDRPSIEGWQAPFDKRSETSPEVKLARRVQTEIKGLIAARTETGPIGKRRPLRYGDMLVLVRRRGKAFDAIIQALKHAGIPVAGADRLKLTEHIAIIDLMNLADALLLPQDDLALATVLKSPLFSLDDDDLFKLAWERTGSLRDALGRQAEGNPKLTGALKRLIACEKRFASETPFAFYAWLLGGDHGRARILRRLGHEANDALDEFLELALGYERKAPASLQGFVAWLRAADTEVKRDMEITRDEVRVMTVHGAKGLEAPVVFMVDTTSSPADSQRLNLIHLPQGNAAPQGPGVVVWAGKKVDDPPAVATARADMIRDTEDEYRRLLYVAMTRAADRLIVGGCMPGNRNEVRPLSWYDLIQKGLENSGLHMQQVPPPDGVVKRYTRVEDVTPAPGAAMPVAAAAPIVLPAWLRDKVGDQPRRESLLRPSDAEDDDGRGQRTGESERLRQLALQRGNLVHRLLQSLPDIAAEKRRETGLNFLARNAKDWTDLDRAALATHVLSLIGDPRLAELFAPGSRAEVAVAGRLTRKDGSPVLVSGQIDRLVLTKTEIRIVDYKTNHNPPRKLIEAPKAYIRQLALYRGVLAKLYPDRPIRAALLWTETIEMMEISGAALDAELAAIISA
ncbi:double-strand break repair helicase AddA [Tardiphaga sp. 768_D3_N2_1]|uniref:double-strand break repair helicase AddA n=1 Tax=Tardiphaga sp. 768_D3_N2_1 TaxID=3240783 RepID=UPI003F8A67E8